jgi:hypothetical protein
MRVVNLKLPVFVLAIVILASLGASQDSWNLGPSEDWLSAGPVYHIGPFYYPYTYPAYMPIGYYQPYAPGYYNPYFYNPQYELDLAAATHSYQKSLANFTGKYRYPYPYDPQYELDLAAATHAYQKSLANYYNKYYWNYPY